MTAVRELSSLRRDHPRLFLTPGRLEALEKGIPGDPFLEELKKALFQQADTLLEREAVEFRIVGPRMLERCQELLRRVSALSLAFRISGREQYLNRARRELCAAAAYPHWNADHFLDTAELCTAFAIGYDWLHDDLPEWERQQLRRSLIEKGLGPGVELQRKPAWWVSARNNWNTVCNGGLLIGALAIADEEPELAAAILRAAMDNLPLALHGFAPDGAWEAGPHYWEYTAWYSALTGDALTTALGTDLGLFGCSGFDRAGLFLCIAAVRQESTSTTRTRKRRAPPSPYCSGWGSVSPCPTASLKTTGCCASKPTRQVPLTCCGTSLLHRRFRRCQLRPNLGAAKCFLGAPPGTTRSQCFWALRPAPGSATTHTSTWVRS